MSKEQIYDAEISPLMAQIIAVCKANGIAMIASFAIPTEEDSDLCCSTCLLDETGENGVNHKEAFQVLCNGNARPAMHLRTDHGDGRVTVATIL